MNKQVRELVWANKDGLVAWAVANPQTKGDAIYWALLEEGCLDAMADEISKWGLSAGDECDAIEQMADVVTDVVEQIQDILGYKSLPDLVEGVGAISDNTIDTLKMAVTIAQGRWSDVEITIELGKQLAEWA